MADTWRSHVIALAACVTGVQGDARRERLAGGRPWPSTAGPPNARRLLEGDAAVQPGEETRAPGEIRDQGDRGAPKVGGTQCMTGERTPATPAQDNRMRC